MEDQLLTMFKELTETPGAPGHEGPVREIMKKYIAPFADEVFTDNLGSLIACQKGTAEGPKVMVAGHLDEVAFMVTMITDQGFCVSSRLVGGGSRLCLLNESPFLPEKDPLKG